MLWFVIALQAMTPFIHAHAGAVQLDHTGFLHGHQGVHGDAAWHAMATDEHGAGAEVAQGMPLRNVTPATADAAPLAASWMLPRVATATRPSGGLPAPPPHRVPPDHTLPHALAPPAA